MNYALIRHRVISRTTPGMATQYALYAKPQATQRSVLNDCLPHVFRACRGVTAGWWRERRDAMLVEPYRCQEQTLEDDGDDAHEALIFSRSFTMARSMRGVGIRRSVIQMKAMCC